MNKPHSISTAPSTPTAEALMKGSARMKAKDAFYKVGTGIHRAIFNVSKGRIFGKAFGMPLGRRRTAAGSWEVGRGGAEG
jgi:hypothetical protein